MRWWLVGVTGSVVLFLGSAVDAKSFLVCPDEWADPTSNGIVTVADVQCAALVALSAMADAPVPACAKAPQGADTTCDGDVDVQDVQVLTKRTLLAPLGGWLDSDADGCPTACQTVEKCPVDLCEGVQCGDVTCGGQTVSCGGACKQGLVCTDGKCVLPGSCFGACQVSSPKGCFCDAACFVAGDCCADVCAMCSGTFPSQCQAGGVCGDGACSPGAGETCASCPVDCSCLAGAVCDGSACVPGSGLCNGACGQQSPLADCWCDASCAEYGDCCADACTYCSGVLGDACAPLPAAKSCAGHCGSGTPGGCYCDAECVAFGDCCADACELCPTVVSPCASSP